MIDVRRAYRRWVRRRLLWLVPSFLLACIVGVVLASDPTLSTWVRLPSLALATGVALLFGSIIVRTGMVAREQARGRSRRSQLLRMELRPSAKIALALDLLLLALLSVHAFFPEAPPMALPGVVRHYSRSAAPGPSPAPVAVPPEVEPVEPVVAAAPEPPPAPEPALAPAPAPAPVTPPQILPEIAHLPELRLRLEDLELFVHPPVQQEDSGVDRFGMKHRPDDDEDLLRRALHERAPFRRAGVPAESELESWIPPEVQVEFALISRSGPWRGHSFEIGVDLPVGRDDSVRLTYMAMMLTDDEELDGMEPSFTWHRGTVEYVRRLMGYTRQSMFDLALMIGMSLDGLSTHEALIRFDSSARLSPWFGLESAIWEDDGVGLILRVGHSLATRLTGGSSSVTEVRVAVRIDLGERSSIELGYRIVTVRFRDRHGPSEDDFTDKMDRSFMGPVIGLALRF